MVLCRLNSKLAKLQVGEEEFAGYGTAYDLCFDPAERPRLENFRGAVHQLPDSLSALDRFSVKKDLRLSLQNPILERRIFLVQLSLLTH